MTTDRPKACTFKSVVLNQRTVCMSNC